MRNVAHALGRSVSNISREIGKNGVKGKYDPAKAQHKAYVRRHNASFRGKSIVADGKLRKFVETNLLDWQTPEGISGRLRHREKDLPYVSKDTIYRFLRSPYGKIIGAKLKKKKRPPKRGRKRKATLDGRTFIDKRPKCIENRRRTGDMEADFVVSGKGGKGVLLVAVCRKLRVAFLEIIHDVSVDSVHAAFERMKGRFPEMKSLTLDNDILFRMHGALGKLLGVKIYFCHPCHSREKGSVENANKFIRKFIPRGSDLSRYSKEEILSIEKRLNRRFMKCLDYATPEEKLEGYRKRKERTKKQRGALR